MLVLLVLSKRKRELSRFAVPYLLKCQMLLQTKTKLIHVPISKKLIQVKNKIFRRRIRRKLRTCCAQRKIQGNLPVLKRGLQGAGEGLSTGACSDRTRENSFKLKEVRVSLAIRKKFFGIVAFDLNNRNIEIPLRDPKIHYIFST